VFATESSKPTRRCWAGSACTRTRKPQIFLWSFWRGMKKQTRRPPKPGNLAGSSVSGTNRESFPPHAIDIVYGALRCVWHCPFVYVYVDAIDVVRLVTFLRLIQSQSQTGPASSEALKHNPQTLTLVLLQDIERLDKGVLRYLHYSITFQNQYILLLIYNYLFVKSRTNGQE